MSIHNRPKARWRQRGLSLVELVTFIVIVSVAVVGILQVMRLTTEHSADPLLQQQAVALAEALLAEVESQPFGNVSSYDNFNLAGGSSRNPPLVDAPVGYSASVAVAAEGALGPSGTQVPDTDAWRITVTVTYSGGNVVLEGYRTKYTSPVAL